MPIKFEQKSFSGPTGNGDVGEEEMDRRWEQTFGRKPKKQEPAEEQEQQSCEAQHSCGCPVDKGSAGSEPVQQTTVVEE